MEIDEEYCNEMKRTTVIKPVLNLGGRNANMPCFWDHHPFEGHPVVIPIKYDCYRNRFDCWGNFCSPNCAKAYLLTQKGADLPTRLHWFRRIMWSHYGVPAHTPIHSAPPIWTLYHKKFDNIEHFRAATVTTDYREVRPPLSIVTAQLQETIHNTAKAKFDAHREQLANDLAETPIQRPAQPSEDDKPPTPEPIRAPKPRHFDRRVKIIRRPPRNKAQTTLDRVWNK